MLREGLAATDDRDALVRLYALLLEQKRSAEAEREVTAWNARHANSIAGMMAAADVRLARSELKDAERWYRSALRLQPDNPIVLNNLAWVLGQAGDTSSVDIARAPGGNS
ncbi:tetratricopeptide repeat protein [Mycobacterium tuberculosis]|uniref:tetratricopeptide repeat protein n=1 Tax=Mycobacterium tuberculosis TaxID=1773 RepID=UPI00272C621A|nr:tetratricopeptide repeat protein [Mycobacterium tuberculosis]